VTAGLLTREGQRAGRRPAPLGRAVRGPRVGARRFAAAHL